MPIAEFRDALKVVNDAQTIIDYNINLISETLDGALLKNGSYKHISDEDLEDTILSLPNGCFYSVYLKREWRERQTRKETNETAT